MVKEVQKNIIEKPIKESEVREEEFLSVLKLIVPGTNFRTALDGALKLRKGALVVVENENTSSIFDGGFRINAKFTPQKLMELVKMDGAIILSKDLKRINFANVILTPNSKINSVETGSRHRAAERTAKQSGTLAIAISERRNEITLYYKNIRYPLIETGELLRRANEHIQLLEKQRSLFDKNVEKLTASELKNYFDLKNAIQTIQTGKLIQKIEDELKKYCFELGDEAMLIKLSLKEISKTVDKETDLIIKDYTLLPLKKSKEILENFSYNELFDENNVAKSLGYESSKVSGESIGGWRILSKTSLIDSQIASLIVEAGNLGTILRGDTDFFSKILMDENLGNELKNHLEKFKSKF